jgi:hypothetical protein
MGTVLLSVLAGHWRYAHINGLRGDGINPGLLGMNGVVSEDAVRLAMVRIPQSAGLDWISTQVLGSISPALGLPWILDIDVTVKPLYGHQQGAEIGYNPQKPGRPSHVYHSYFVANLRISLGVEIRPGNEHAAAKGLPGLWQTLEKLPRHQWPTFTRGDCGYGSEITMLEHEQRGLPYLFKLRHTAKVKELVNRMMRQGALWQDCGDGWQALETTLRLSGWTRDRRVILVRENPAKAPVRQAGKPRRGKDRQKLLPNAILRELNRPDVNILTLENPVEDEVPGITHCDLKSPKEFKPMIASFMRSDPDIILMGEVRDIESAELAIEAAVTGHKVLTTIHTARASQIIERFEQLGLERWKIAQTLKAACAQRLVKLLCPYCKEPSNGIEEFDRKTFSLDDSWGDVPVFTAKSGGCQECRNTGYSGRTAILEIIPISPKISDLLAKGEMTPYELEMKVAEEGVLPNLRRSGLRLLRDGKTDLVAVSKVIDMTYTDD